MADEENQEGEGTQDEVQPQQESQASTVTATLEAVARWRVHATSAGAQGADGTAELTRTAFAALQSAEWEYDDAPATMPTHEFNREEPSGQAYKACWGYIAAERTQRSCCGAECYTYRIPEDALDSSNEAGVAAIHSVTASVAVDRYCSKGAVVVAILTGSITPPPFAEALSIAALSPAWFPTDAQTDAEGGEIAPNKRSDDGGNATFSFGASPVAPDRYLHVFLLLSDYLGHRKGWIDGSAMFSGATADVEFSRAVTPSVADDALAVTPMTLGRLTDLDAPEAARARALYGNISGGGVFGANFLPRASFPYTWSLRFEPALLTVLADDSPHSIVDNILAYLYSATTAVNLGGEAATTLSAVPISGGNTYANESSGDRAHGMKVALSFTKTEVSDNSITSRGGAEVQFATIVLNGLTRGKVFRGLLLKHPINASNRIPLRICAYGISEDFALGAGRAGSTVVPWCWGVLSRSFREGKATSLRIYANPAAATGSLISAAHAESATVAVPATPLAAFDCTDATSRIPFMAPWKSGEISTVVIAAIPDGVPIDGNPESDPLQATVTRTVTATLPDSGAAKVARTEITQTAHNVSTRVWASYTPPNGQSAAIWLREHGIIPGWRGDDSWASTANLPRIKEGVRMTLDLRVAMTVSFDGISYSIDSTYRRALDVTWYFNLWGNLNVDVTAINQANAAYCTATVFPHTVNLVGTASSGQKRTFSCHVGFFTMTIADGGFYDNVFSGWCEYIDPGSCSRGGFDIDTHHIEGSSIHADWSDYVQSSSSVHDTTGYNYAWASQSGGSVQASTNVVGSATVTKDNKKYTASLNPRSIKMLPLTLSGKTAASYASGGDKTARADIAGTLPEDAQTLVFVAKDGSSFTANLALPAASFTSAEGWGGKHVTAKGVATKSGQTIASRTAADTGQTATPAETLSAEQTLDFGTVSLYE